MTLENFAMKHGGDDYDIVLKSPLTVCGTVVDAETNKPIDRFTVIKEKLQLAASLLPVV